MMWCQKLLLLIPVLPTYLSYYAYIVRQAWLNYFSQDLLSSMRQGRQSRRVWALSSATSVSERTFMLYILIWKQEDRIKQVPAGS